MASQGGPHCPLCGALEMILLHNRTEDCADHHQIPTRTAHKLPGTLQEILSGIFS